MAGYIGSVPVPQSTQTRDSFVATEGQTSFATKGYTPGFVDVFLNGIHLDPADFTATNGTDIVLASGATVNDVVTVVAFSVIDLSSTQVPQGANRSFSTTENLGTSSTGTAHTLDSIASHNGNRILVIGDSFLSFKVNQDENGTIEHQIKLGSGNWTKVAEASGSASQDTTLTQNNRKVSFAQSFEVASSDNLTIQFRMVTAAHTYTQSQTNTIVLSAISYQEDD